MIYEQRPRIPPVAIFFQVCEPVTIIETPPMTVVGVLGYIKSYRGEQTYKTVWAQHISEDCKRRFYKNYYASKKAAFRKVPPHLFALLLTKALMQDSREHRHEVPTSCWRSGVFSTVVQCLLHAVDIYHRAVAHRTAGAAHWQPTTAQPLRPVVELSSMLRTVTRIAVQGELRRRQDEGGPGGHQEALLHHPCDCSHQRAQGRVQQAQRPEEGPSYGDPGQRWLHCRQGKRPLHRPLPISITQCCHASPTVFLP